MIFKYLNEEVLGNKPMEEKEDEQHLAQQSYAEQQYLKQQHYKAEENKKKDIYEKTQDKILEVMRDLVVNDEEFQLVKKNVYGDVEQSNT